MYHHSLNPPPSMALLFFPRSLSVAFLPFFGSGSVPRSNRCTCSLSAQTPALTSCGRRSGDSAILWFKQDLRVDDHPGLVEASKCSSLVPLYVFDHRIISRYSDDMLELVIFALEDLRQSLQEQGSNLMIRFGNAENAISDLVQEVKATHIFAEEEVEYHIKMTMGTVEANLVRLPLLDGNPKIVLWQTPFYDIKSLKDIFLHHMMTSRNFN